MQNDPLKDTIVHHISSMSENDFQAFGADGLAYIRSTGFVDNIQTFSVHAADGSHIASGPDVAMLQAIAMQDNRVAMMIQ